MMRGLALVSGVALSILIAGAALAQPFEIDRVDAPCCPVDIARVGDHLVVAYDDPAHFVGLRVYDYSDPAAPAYVSSVALDAAPRSISSSWWHYVYVAAGTDGLRVVDLNDASAPEVVASLPVVGDAFRVEVKGYRAYVGTRYDGLHVFDASWGAPAVFMATFDGFASALIDFDAGGTRVGTCSYTGVSASPVVWRVYDFADPSAPVLLASQNEVESYGAILPLRCTRVASNGGDFFIDGIRETVTFPQSPTIHIHGIVAFDFPTYGTPRDIGYLDGEQPLDGLAAHGGLVHSLNDGLLRVAGSDQEGPLQGLLGSVELWPGGAPVSTTPERERAWSLSRPLQMVAEEGLVFTTAGHADVAAYDVSDPASPALLSLLRTNGDIATHVELAGDALVVSDDNLGLRIFDVSKPWRMRQVASLPTLGGEIEVSGSLLFAGSSDPWGLQIVDVSTSAAPSLLGFVPLPISDLDDLDDLAVSDSAVVVMAGGSVRVIDVVDPLAPTDLGVLGSGWSSLDLEGGLLVLNDVGSYDTYLPPDGLSVLLDISNPAMPVHLATLLDVHQRPAHARIVGDHLFLFSSDAMWAYDISTPSSPVEVAGLAVDHTTWRRGGEIEVDGDRLIVPGAYTGLTVVNVADPAAPWIEDAWLAGVPVEGVAVGDSVIFTAESIDGVASYALDASAVPSFSPLLRTALVLALIGVAAAGPWRVGRRRSA